MSESEEENQENNEHNRTEVTIKSNISDKPIKIEGTTEDIEKFKQIMKAQKEYDNSVISENERLKRERAEKLMEEYGNVSSSAPLNSNQLSGMSNEEINRLMKDVLPSDNSGLPADMMTFHDDFDMINQLEKMAQSGDKETKAEASQALAKLLQKATEKSFDFEYNGDPRDLYRKPKNEKERIELSKKRQQWERIR